jgi:hypothetical protein
MLSLSPFKDRRPGRHFDISKLPAPLIMKCIGYGPNGPQIVTKTWSLTRPLDHESKLGFRPCNTTTIFMLIPYWTILLGPLSTNVVYYGTSREAIEQRRVVRNAAFSAHPERFVREPPQPLLAPKEGWNQQATTV